MRTIGVDPGSRYTGYAIVEGDGFRLNYIHHGTIKLPAGRPLCARLKIIFEEINASIGQYRPQFMAVEEVFFAKNVKSALSLGQARGAVILAGACCGLSVHEYSALRIKQSVAGYGRASKEQVSGMVHRLFRIDGEIEPNAADALAIAVCHISTHSSNLRWKFATSKDSTSKNSDIS
ncbi:MAG: crossover junction endodeoxyribonuclease RuvC [Syntrophobacteraceae bacterium]